MRKEVIFDSVARDAIKKGVDTLANAVKVTLGPKGRNVVINKGTGFPIITKDGVTVARDIELEDPLQNTGIQMIRGVAEKTVEKAGDGTTTATVLAQAIITEGINHVTQGSNPIDIKKGIDLAVAAAVENINKQSSKVDGSKTKLEQVALISTNNDHALSNLISNAMHKIGADGIVQIDDSNNHESRVEFVQGFTVDRGIILPHFMTNPAKGQAELESPFILLYDKKISNMQALVPLMEKLIEAERSLLIIAEDVEDAAIRVILKNNHEGTTKIAVIRSPEFGDLRHLVMEDIAIATGGKVVFEESELLSAKNGISFLGEAGKILSDQFKTVIIGAAGDKVAVKTRMNQLQETLDDVHSDQNKEVVKERLGRLSSNVATMFVGAPTEIEVNEKKDRIDDAIHATRAAMREGIVAGGGITFIRAIHSLKDLKGKNPDEMVGIDIVRRALEAPFRQICHNSGMVKESIDKKLEYILQTGGNFGYNARTEQFCDLVQEGVIDPALVSRVALENAGSIASMLLTTECLILNIK